jgi:membrane protease YdiL (CAAX protease family)
VDEESLAQQLLAPQPDSPSPGEARGFGRVPWGWLDITVVCVVAAVTQLAVVPAGTAGMARMAGQISDSAPIGFFAQVIVSYTLLMGVMWLVALRRHRVSWESLGFRPVDLRGLGALLGVLAAAVIVMNLMMRLVIDPPRMQNPFLLGHGPAGIALTALLVIGVAPVVEEAFFRGFLLQGLAGRLRFWPAAVVTSAVFAVAHIWPYLFPPIFLLGLAFAWLFWRTGSLWTAVAAHATLNATSFLIILLDPF